MISDHTCGTWRVLDNDFWFDIQDFQLKLSEYYDYRQIRFFCGKLVKDSVFAQRVRDIVHIKFQPVGCSFAATGLVSEKSIPLALIFALFVSKYAKPTFMLSLYY